MTVYLQGAWKQICWLRNFFLDYIDPVPLRTQVAVLATLLRARVLLGLHYNPEDGDYVPLRLRLTFSGLHSMIFQTIELAILTLCTLTVVKFM